jgi:hypothetical protein
MPETSAQASSGRFHCEIRAFKEALHAPVAHLFGITAVGGGMGGSVGWQRCDCIFRRGMPCRTGLGSQAAVLRRRRTPRRSVAPATERRVTGTTVGCHVRACTTYHHAQVATLAWNRP